MLASRIPSIMRNDPKQTKHTRTNMLQGLKWGAIAGSAFAVWTLVVALVSGHGAFTERYDAPPLVVTIVYLLGGTLAGTVIAMLQPFARSRRGWILVGILAVLPFGAGIRFAKYGAQPWMTQDTVGLAVFSIALGGIGGAIAWEMFRAN